MIQLDDLIVEALEVVHSTMTGSQAAPRDRLDAAVALLEFAASAAPRASGCDHSERRNMSTLGGGPLIEVCENCGVTFEDGVIVVRS